MRGIIRQFGHTHWLVLGMGLCLGIAVTAVSMPQATGQDAEQAGQETTEIDTARVKRLELVDDEGQVRAILGFESAGIPGFAEFPSLRLVGASGQTALRLGFDHPQGIEPTIQMFDADDDLVAELRHGRQGRQLQASFRMGERYARLTINNDEGPTLTLGEPDGGSLITGLHSGGGDLVLYGKDDDDFEHSVGFSTGGDRPRLLLPEDE